MNLRRTFRQCYVEAVGQGGRLPIKQLQDFFIDVPEQCGIHAMAGKALAYFALSDGKFNLNITALLAVFAFLNQTTGVSPTDTIRKDLKKILDSDPSEQDLVDWAKANF